MVAMLPKELVQLAEEPERGGSDTGSDAELSFPAVEGIDWNIALQHASGYEMVKETVVSFLTTLDGEAEYLEECCKVMHTDEEAINKYRIKVHSMKSSAALIGAMELSGKAKELEHSARELDVENVLTKTPDFLQEWRSYKEKLLVCINTEEKLEIEDMSEIVTNLENLRAAMDEMDVDTADELMKQLNRYQYTPEVQADMDRLAVCVMNLDSEQAAGIIEGLMNKL